MIKTDAEYRTLHARAVESAIMQSLRAAQAEPAREEFWRAHADKLEKKFTTEYGRHYSHFLARYVEKPQPIREVYRWNWRNAAWYFRRWAHKL